MNMNINDNNLTDLEKLLIKLKSIVGDEYDASLNVNTPCIITGTEEDGDYEGKLLILVGDDTCIREQDGKFYVYDFHDEEAEPLLLTEKEILDFYKGQYDAYGVPDLEDESYHYIRGYHQVMSYLSNMMKSQLIAHENLHKNQLKP